MSPNHTTTLRITATSAAHPRTVALRVPFWATGANTVSLNGQPVRGSAPALLPPFQIVRESAPSPFDVTVLSRTTYSRGLVKVGCVAWHVMSST